MTTMISGYIDSNVLTTKASENNNKAFAEALRAKVVSTKITGFNTELDFPNEVVVAQWMEAPEYTGSADNVSKVSTLSLSSQTRTFPSTIKAGDEVTIAYTLEGAEVQTEIHFAGKVTNVSPNYVTITSDKNPASGKVLGNSAPFTATAA
jgi:hypothetical protein